MINMFKERFTYKWQVLLVAIIGTFMAILDSSIVNVSLPVIMADFGSSVDDIQWVVTGYMLSYSTFMPLTGWFRDKIGHKNLYIFSISLFTIGSFLCVLSWNLPSLIVARIIQAFGAGSITPTAMSMISDVFDPRERGRALGYWGLGIIVAPAIGPTLGGILTRTLGWRSIFMVNLPIGVICVLIAMVLIKKDILHNLKRRFDLAGFLFLSLFLFAFLLGLSKGNQEGWTSFFILACFSLSLIGLVGFLLVESLVPDGIIDLTLFKSPVFSICMLVNAVRAIALFGSTFLLPVFMQNLMGLDEITTGLILLPGALVMAFLIPMVGRMADKIGPRIPSIIGLLLLAWFMYIYRNLNVNTRIIDIIWPTIIRSAGLVLLMAPIMAASLNAAPRRKAAVVSSFSALIQQVGGAIGIAILTTMLTMRTAFHMNSMGSSIRLGTAAQHFLHQAATWAMQLGHNSLEAVGVARGLLFGHVVQTASVAGFEDAFLFGMVIALLAIIPALFLPLKVEIHKEQETDLIVME